MERMMKGPSLRLFAHTSEHIVELSEEIALTVTSPPYWNAIDYEQHSLDPSQWYRTRDESAYEEYLHFLDRCFAEVLRVTKAGGFCAVVIGTVLLEGRHYPLPFDFTGRMVRLGWRFHQDIVWYKVTGGVKRAGVFIQRQLPGYFYPNIMTEYILIFSKEGEAIYRQVDEKVRAKAQQPIDDLVKKEIANTVWHIPPVPPNHLPHPCPFPEEIPFRLINLYSYPGDTILDPFLGIGTTLKVARYLGRNGVGYEIRPEYLETARQMIFEPPALRKEQLFSRFETHPVDFPQIPEAEFPLLDGEDEDS